MRGLSNDADRDQLPQQAEGRLRRDRQAVRQAARGDDRGAQHVIEVRARGISGRDVACSFSRTPVLVCRLNRGTAVYSRSCSS